MNARLDVLVEAYLEGRLAAAEKTELEALLRASSAARHEFWQRASLHGLLHEAVRLKTPAVIARPIMLPWFALAAAFLIALFAGASLLVRNPSAKIQPAVAASTPEQNLLVPEHGTLWLTRAGLRQSVTTHLALVERDAIRVAPGSAATIRYTDGTILHLEENTELSLGGPALQNIQFAAGRVQADVTPHSERAPVELATPLARLTVHGTRFVLDAQARATRLEVTEGQVRMVHTQRDSDMDIGAGQYAVAVADAPLLGGVTRSDGPAQPVPAPDARALALHPFRPDSPWNRALDGQAHLVNIASPVLDLAGRGLAVHPAGHDREIILAQPDDPATAVISRYQGTTLATLPLPATALANAGRLRNVTVIDGASGLAYELIQADRVGNTVRAMLVNVNDLSGSGHPPEQVGHTWSGLPLAAGVIRKGELQSGIPHALAASALHTALSRHPAPAEWPALAAPMERKLLGHMAAEGNVRFGTRLALPAGLDLSTLGVGSSGPAYEIAVALQRYGLYVTHSYGPAPADGRGGWVQPHLILFAEASEPELRTLSQTVAALARHLKVVSNPEAESTP